MVVQSKLLGVNYYNLHADTQILNNMRCVENEILKEGVSFGKHDKKEAPWLLGTSSFKINPLLFQELFSLGKAFYLFFDHLQYLYKNNHELVEPLDIGTEENLRGLDLDKTLKTFRLDIILKSGKPVITEVEEVYGNIGKVIAMSKAYNIGYQPVLDRFTNLELSSVFLDDTVLAYTSELRILTKHLDKISGNKICIKPFSLLNDSDSGNAWKFCYTKDFSQYGHEKQKKILNGNINFVNPLFHGYGSKTILALIHDESLKAAFSKALGPDVYHTLLRSTPKSIMFDRFRDLNYLVNNRDKWVLRVADCRENLDLNWGARGVFFPGKSKKKWEKLLGDAKFGYVELNENKFSAYFMLCELIDSDCFDVEFWNKNENCISIMNKARIRLSPIFFREGEKIYIIGGHATFVNTSRKVHLGKHAVCVPLEIDTMINDFE